MISLSIRDQTVSVLVKLGGIQRPFFISVRNLKKKEKSKRSRNAMKILST